MLLRRRPETLHVFEANPRKVKGNSWKASQLCEARVRAKSAGHLRELAEIDQLSTQKSLVEDHQQVCEWVWLYQLTKSLKQQR